MGSVRALVLLLACGCSSPPPAGGPDASAPRDLAGADQARTIVGIACGGGTCTVGAEFCCTADRGVTGDCIMAANPACGSTQFLCDGPEDCPPASPECCVANGAAQCRPFGECATLGVQFAILCHFDPTCGTGRCCQAPNGSPYSICFDTACP